VRLERLGLAAYGPFSEFELDFTGAPRLELVFGANEAGKSTALRAVRGLLFGIPEQTGDAHRYPASELAIEASLSDDRGEAVFLRRRRKRKDSLRDRDDTPLAEDTLGRLLGGIDAAAYERLFAFDHERLALSAEEMLKGKGDVGEALFAAGAGNSAVGAVLRELAEQAAEIFTPLARTRPLNVLIKDYRALQAELRKTRLLPDAYLAQREKIAEAEGEAQRIRSERRELESELAKLSRVERALPWLARLRAAESELSGQSLPSILPSDVTLRRVSAERERDSARSELRHYLAERARDSERLARLGALPKLARVSEATLLGLLGSSSAIRTAKVELPERRAELLLLSAEVLELAQKYGLAAELASAIAISIRADELARARRLVGEHAVLVEAEQHLLRRQREVTLRLAHVDDQRSEDFAEQLDALERAIDAAHGAHDLASREHESEQALARLERDAQRARARLVPSPPEHLGILDWVLPSDETLERLARGLSELTLGFSRLSEREQRAHERTERVAQETQRIELSFALPSEQDLLTARARRDVLLAELLAATRDARPEASELQQALALSIARADELGDRLRREASRVGELMGLRAEAESLERERKSIGAERTKLESEQSALLSEHRSGFEEVQIAPLPPAEMRAWLVKCAEARRLASDLEAAHERRVTLADERTRLTRLLAFALGKPDSSEEPATLLREAERAASRVRAHREARHDAERARAQALAELASVESELALHTRARAQFQEQYAAAEAALGLPRHISPEELGPVLEGLGSLAERLGKRARVAAEIETLERRSSAFDAEVRELTQSYADDLALLPTEQALAALVTRQREVLAQARERQALGEKLAELDERQAASEVKLSDAEAALAELSTSLGLQSPEELPHWEMRAARLRSMASQLEEAERELLALGEGRSVEALSSEVFAVAADEVAPRKREILEELERLEQAFYQVRRDAEGLEAGLLLLGGESAADVAQRLSQVAAAIREQARYYAELRVAHGILARELAEFRERNQGPILERASGLFARLTLGSFRGLRVGLDAAVLECVRAGGQGLSVAELSEGVRYQLYFALRLASLERYLERGHALPLVLDDVFIHWDDERALSGFQVLGELCERTQVLFFTHHAHLAEVAARALGPRLRRHALPAPGRAA